MFNIQSPANSGSHHPLGELMQGPLINAETGRHSAHFQQIHQLTHATTLLWQSKQPVHRPNEWAAGFGAHVSNVKWDEAGVLALVLAKDGPDGRRHLFDVGHHHNHIAGIECVLVGGCGQQLQQLIVQDFEFPHLAVGAVKHDGVVRIGQ